MDTSAYGIRKLFSGGSSTQPPAYPYTSGSSQNQYVPQPTVPVQQVVIVQVKI